MYFRPVDGSTGFQESIDREFLASLGTSTTEWFEGGYLASRAYHADSESWVYWRA